MICGRYMWIYRTSYPWWTITLLHFTLLGKCNNFNYKSFSWVGFRVFLFNTESEAWGNASKTYLNGVHTSYHGLVLITRRSSSSGYHGYHTIPMIPILPKEDTPNIFQALANWEEFNAIRSFIWKPFLGELLRACYPFLRKLLETAIEFSVNVMIGRPPNHSFRAEILTGFQYNGSVYSFHSSIEDPPLWLRS